MPNNNTIPSWDETVEIKETIPSFEDTTPVEVKKKESFGFGDSESLVLPSVATEDKNREPLELDNNKYKTEVLSSIKDPKEKQAIGSAIDEVDRHFANLGGKTPFQKISELNRRMKEMDTSINPEAIARMNEKEMMAFQQQYTDKARTVANELGLNVDQEGNISVPENEKQMYQQKLADYINVEKSKQKKDIGFFENLSNKLASGTETAGADILDMLGMATGLNYFKSYKDIAEGKRVNAAQFSQKAGKYDNTIEEYLKAGEVDKAAGLAVSSAVESLPAMIPMFMNPEYGLYMMSASSAVNKYRDIENTNVPEWKKVYNAVLSGAAEFAGEKLVTIPILTKSKQAILSLGREQGKQAIEGAVKQAFEKETSKIALPSFVTEGLSEVATGLSQDLTDKVTTNPNIQIGATAVDNFTVGAVMGKVFSLPQDISKIVDKKQARDFATKVLDKLPSDMDIESKINLGWKIVERDKLQEAEDKLDPKFKGKYETQLVTLNSEIDKAANEYLGKAKVDEVPELSVGKVDEVGDEQQKLDYLKSKDVKVPDGTTMEQLNVLYDETKQKEEPKAPVVSEAKPEVVEQKQEPVVVELPKPSKPIEQMSSEEIRSFSDEIKQHEKNIYSSVFGEQADRFKQLEQSSNNPTKTKEQLKAIDAEMQQMIDALPKEKKDIWESEAEYNAADLRDMSRMVGLVEESENIKELTSSLKNPLMTFSKDKNNKQTLAIFNAAIKKAQELGISTEELIGQTSKLISKEFKDPQDAMDVVKSALESIAQPSEVKQEPIKAIEAAVEPVEPQTKQKGVVAPSETKVAEKQQKEVVVEPAVEQKKETATPIVSEEKVSTFEEKKQMGTFNYTKVKETEKAEFIKIPYWEKTGEDKSSHKQQYYETWVPKSVIEKGSDAIKNFAIQERNKKRIVNPYQKGQPMPSSWNTMGEVAPTKDKSFVLERDEAKIKEIGDGLNKKYGTKSLKQLLNEGLAEETPDEKLLMAIAAPQSEIGKANQDLVPTIKRTVYKQQQKQPIVGEQIEVKQVRKEQDEKSIGKGGEETIQGRQENVLVEAKRKLEREVRKEENKERLGRIFDNAAKLTGARLDITSEEKKAIRKELARDVVDYVRTEFDLLGEALVEKVKSFVKDNSIPLEDISDQELNDVLKEQGYAEGIRSQDKGNAEAQEGVVKGAERKVSVGNDGKDQKTPRGENVRQQGAKIISSTTLPEDIKADFEKEGVSYLPRGRKVTREESTQIAQDKLQMEGGREQLKKDILDPTNNIKGDTRIALAVEFVKDAKNTLLKATSQKEIDKARADITDILTYTMNRSTDVAQELEANKMITELLGSDPEFIEDVYRNDINKKNEPFYEAQKENIKSAQEIITEYLNSEEFKNKYKVKPPKQGADKLTSKQLRDRGINKIANATSKLADLIGAKKNFTQEEMGKGTDLFDILKELGDGILDVGVASTKELMDKIKANTRKYFKPSEIDQISKVLIEELKAEERVKAKTARTISLDTKDEKVLVDRLYSKVINANEKQLKQLLADNVDLLVREGSINDEAFKELFAKAMGKDFVDQKQIDKLKASAQLVQDLKVIEAELEKMFNHAIEAELNGVPKAEIDAIKKQINAKLKEHTEATHNAEKAAKVIGETLAGKGDLAEKIGAVIKGNLITPASQVVNIIGNYSMLPVRSTKNVVSTSLDILLSGVGYLNEMAIAKVNAKEIAFINKESERLGIPKDKVHVPIVFAKTKRALAKLPSVRRTKTGFGLSKQRFIGEGKGYVQGIKQLWTGSLPTDLQRVELRAGLHPLDAMINNYNMLTGKEKLEFKKFAENFYESTIGIAPEVTFRLLNLFDKPVRIGAERDKLNQLADLKNLKGMERQKFLEMPDLESAEIARKAGDEATFQQDTWLSQWSSKLDQKMLKGAKETTNIMSKAAYYTGYYAKNMVVPFVKTPINVEMELLGYAVPELAVARGLFAMYHGDRQGFTENMGKAIVGSYMLRGIGYLFGAGIMTLASGGHEDDNDEFIAPKIKAAEYRDKPAYYINIDAWQRDIQNKIYGTKLSIEWQEGDQISSYRRMGIVSAMAMAQAEAYRGKSKEEIKAMNFWQTAHTSIPALVKSGAEQTFVSGTSSLINVFIGTEYERDNFFLGLSKAAGASVLPNAVKTYVMANDNLIRETKDATKKGVDAIKNKIITDFKASLTTGSDIPTKITIWGERVTRYEDGSTPAFQLFDITKTKTYKSDFGAKIFELYEKISADEELSKEIPPKSVLPPVLSNKIRYKEEDIALDPKTFEDMQIYVGTKLKEKTWATLSSMDWDKASDERKYRKLKVLYNSSNSYRNKLIDRYVSTHKDVLDELWLKQYGAK